MRQLVNLLILSLILFLCTGCIMDLLGGPDSCRPRNDAQSCDYYSSSTYKLTYCHSDGMFTLPNCDVAEYCTDYPADDDTATSTASTETGIDTDSDTDSHTDTATEGTVLKGRVCKQVCEGELIPCEDLGKGKCESAYHCEWYGDAL